MDKKLPHLGTGFRKIQPKLRMVSDGDDQVNEIRSDFHPAVRMAATYRHALEAPAANVLQVLAVTAAQAKKSKLSTNTGNLKALATDARVSVFVECDRPLSELSEQDKATALPSAIDRKSTAERGRFATMEVPISALPEIAEQPAVVRIEMGEALKHPRPKLSSGAQSAPAADVRRFGDTGGEKVLIGIIDVEGFDFAHPDFRSADGKSTRFVSIWDQGGKTRPPPKESSYGSKGFSYGSEILQKQMNAAIAAAPSRGLAPQLLEPQSSMERGSHGTHVASIAAGNRGVCRNAFLAGVLIDLPRKDLDRRRSFYDSTRIAHAAEYLLDVAERLKKEHKLATLPISLNISLGTNGHAHDGSSAICRWLENILATPGRAITVAAGNAGQERGETPDDVGFVMGRIHSSGRIAAAGLKNDIEWTVVGNGTMDVSENELEVWYSPSDRISVWVKPPNADWIGPVHPGQFIENRQLPDKTLLSVYNEIYHPANGANYIGIYLSPFFSPQQIIGITPGVWTVRLEGLEIRDGSYHGWIERDDPAELGPVGQLSAWRFPSFFSARSNVDESSVSSLGCSERILCIANLDETRRRINISSSQGPTRVGGLKPDVAAPGTDIVAALGFNFDDDEQWIAMTGTSMASPFVCGLAGLMLAENNKPIAGRPPAPPLTAAQIRGILQRTSLPLPNADYRWRNDAGYGAVDPVACLAEVRRLRIVENLK